MSAAVLSKSLDLTVENVPIESPELDEVLVKVHAAGICGTDVDVVLGKKPAVLPVIPGHEFAGEVVQVGKEVVDFVEGDRIISEASYPCLNCKICINGDQQHCTNRVSFGRTTNGCFAQFVTVPERALHKISGDVSYLDAQSVTSVATIMRMLNRLGSVNGLKVAVMGAGYAGLLITMILKKGILEDNTPDNLVLFDIVQSRLTLGEKLGADLSCNVKETPWEETLKNEKFSSFDVVVEASGTVYGLRQAIDIITPGGQIILFGIQNPSIDGFPGAAIYNKEITIIGTKGGGGCYEKSLDIMTKKEFDIQPLITHDIPLKKIKRLFDIIINQEEDVMRVVIRPNL